MNSEQSHTTQRPRIGLFTDTYRPTVNGISVVIDTLRRTMELAGWEVFVICPATRKASRELAGDDHIITMPSIKGWPYQEYDISFFWPLHKARQLSALQLDAAMFFTPGQIGQLATLLAQKYDIPLFAQHSTDLVEYVRHYPAGILASMLMLITLPGIIRFSAQDWKLWWGAWRPQRTLTLSGKRVITYGLAIWYRHCSGVVALSRKTARQLAAFPGETNLPIATIPVGVNPFPVSSAQQALAFRKHWGIALGDTVLLYAGRISAEKNLDVLIPTLEAISQRLPSAKLIFAGDFDYRAKLEAAAAQSPMASNIIFTGKIPREELGAVYASADIFMFPSKTDTQGLVLHEAAGAGLPIVMCDPLVTEVVKHGENGYIVPDEPKALAQAVLHIVQDPRLHHTMRLASKQRAATYSEENQTRKLIDCITAVITARR
jgi:1,2-diacylglycerol 3-alpha-glucosyltransferase